MSTDAFAFKPGFDPEAAAIFATLPPSPRLGDDTVRALREVYAPDSAMLREACAARGLLYEEQTIAGPGGDLEMSIIRPAIPLTNAPIYYTIHGGGMVMGNRFVSLPFTQELDWVVEHQMVLVTPEYRLAPEHPAPAGVEDCYAGLIWTAAHAEQWGADASRIIVGGGSGGGGLAAGTVLLARDRGEVDVFAQLLVCPMLDDRNQTVSSVQYGGDDGGPWPRENNVWAWDAVFGGSGHVEEDVSPYVAPARARDLAGLPTTFIDVGAAEVFRDECVDYASRLWAAGVQAELHVWRGGFHGHDFFAASTPVGRETLAMRASWLRRILS